MLRKALPLIASLAVLVASAAFLRLDWPLLTRVQNAVFDVYQQIDPREIENSPVTVVDIDEESLKKLGQWPWPRDYLAFMLQRLRQAGAVVVGFDVVFAEPDRSSPMRVAERLPESSEGRKALEKLGDTDKVFAQAMGIIPTVVATTAAARKTDGVERLPPNLPGLNYSGATFESDPSRFLETVERRIANIQTLEEAAAGVGLINFSPDADGIVRRVNLLTMHGSDHAIPLLAVEVLRVLQGTKDLRAEMAGGSGEIAFGEETGIVGIRVGQFGIPTGSAGDMRIHFAHLDNDRYLSAWKLLDQSQPLPDLTNQIVLVGTSAAGLLDLRHSPIDPIIPGVEIHAQVIDQILEQKFLIRPDYAPGLELIFLVVLGLSVILLVHRVGALWSGLFGAVVVFSAAGVSLWAFLEHRLLFDPVAPSAAALAVFLVSSVGRHWQSEQQQRFIRSAFQSYISPNLVEELLKDPERLKLGGERRECTFIFTDLAGFTSWVESSDPEEAADLLNEYLDRMIQIGFDHGGTLDKVIGDATVFYFNAPVDQPDHAERAYRCALAMEEFSYNYAMRKRAEGIPLGITRAGVNSGVVTIGNFGGKVFDYTAHGDAINTAARLESVNKHLGTRVCISEATVSQVPDFIGRPGGVLVLKGKTQGTPVYEPLSRERYDSPVMQQYLKAYRLLEAEDPSAEAEMRKVLDLEPDDPLAKLHIGRLEAGETGVRIVMTEK